MAECICFHMVETDGDMVCTTCDRNHGPPRYGAVSAENAERLAERIYPYSLTTDRADPGHGMHDIDGAPRPVWEWMRAQRVDSAPG